ncbi:hypothetical protein ACFVUS_36585 [Nocardia sp. NPDC058058]|uniref:hypothetical protein n=1 Tax=Nocardia sp. NPDC058058 TaxID=3346317 RepID=UPI0036DCE5AD
MRFSSIGAAAVTTGVLLALAAAPANAERGDDHPGSCLVVANHSGGPLTLTLKYPEVSGTWNYDDNEQPTVVADEANSIITSPNGFWEVRLDKEVPRDWTYDAEQNSGQGCNGSWLLTVNK